MTESPAIVFKNVEPEARPEERPSRNWIRWVALFLLATAGLGWTLFKMDFHHEHAQPVQSGTINSLKTDAGNATVANAASLGTAAKPDPAASYGVKVGDSVEIVALNPAVAASHATITATTARQLTVRVGGDTFNIRWENLTRLKPAGKK